MARMHDGIDIDELERLTLAGWRTADLADRYGVRRQYVHWLRVKYSLTRPAKMPPPDAPSIDEDIASSHSLQFSPWVQARIKELGIDRWREQSAPDVMVTNVMVANRRTSRRI